MNHACIFVWRDSFCEIDDYLERFFLDTDTGETRMENSGGVAEHDN